MGLIHVSVDHCLWTGIHMITLERDAVGLVWVPLPIPLWVMHVSFGNWTGFVFLSSITAYVADLCALPFFRPHIAVFAYCKFSESFTLFINGCMLLAIRTWRTDVANVLECLIKVCTKYLVIRYSIACIENVRVCRTATPKWHVRSFIKNIFKNQRTMFVMC